MNKDPLIGAGISADGEDSPAARLRLSNSIQRLSTDVQGLTKRTRQNRVFTALVCLALIGTAGLGYQAHVQAECQGKARDRQDEQQIRQLDQQLELFAGLGNPANTPTDRAAALAEYVRSVGDLKVAILDAKKDRADNPLLAWNCS